MKNKSLIEPVVSLVRRCLSFLFVVITLCWWGSSAQARVVFCCEEDNDLYKVVSKDYPQVKREGRTSEEFVFYRNENADTIAKVRSRPFSGSFAPWHPTQCRSMMG